MLPKINNKSFLECSEEDLEVLIDNPDFRENEYIDYKQNFAFLEFPKGKERNTKKVEFKNDVCSFANAEGGYLLFGISDKNGCASELVGIDIPNCNTDKYELDRRNDLASINPKTPYLNFHFVKLKNGRYVVIIYIKNDNFAPYIHIENEKNYQIYKRSGSGKRIMTYTELKNMFNKSISLDKEIYDYRKERINYYKYQSETDSKYSHFMLLHIIPETFMDPSYNHNIFFLEKIKDIHFSSMFLEFGSIKPFMPCVDGIRFILYDEQNIQSECYVNNNGVVECFCPLNNYLHLGDAQYPNGFISWKCIWDKIKTTCDGYSDKFKELYSNEKVFVCISIIGCKGVISNNNFELSYKGKIDRDYVICNPVIINNLNDEEENQLLLKKLYIEYLLSIGVKYNDELTRLIKEVYNV